MERLLGSQRELYNAALEERIGVSCSASRGVFIDSTKLPLQNADVKDELIELAKDGVKRV